MPEVLDAMAELGNGRPVLLCDDTSGVAAVTLSASDVDAAVLRRFTRDGPFSVVVSEQQARSVGLELLEEIGTVNVDAASCAHGAGIDELATTCRELGASATPPAGFRVPGHVRCDLVRNHSHNRGIADAAITLTALAGLRESAIVAPLVDGEGRLVDGAAARHRGALDAMPCVDIEAVVDIGAAAICCLPTAFGSSFSVVATQAEPDGSLLLTLLHGSPAFAGADVIVAAHQSCLLGDAFGSLGCSCGSQLRESIERIINAGRGVLLYRASGFDGRMCGGGPTPALGRAVEQARRRWCSGERDAHPPGATAGHRG